MLGLAWDLKAQKLNPVEDKTTAIPGRLAAGNNVKTLSLGMNGNAGG
jgi:hypothetical protein